MPTKRQVQKALREAGLPDDIWYDRVGGQWVVSGDVASGWYANGTGIYSLKNTTVESFVQTVQILSEDHRNWPSLKTL